MVRLATERGNGAQGDFSSMSVVSCRFGGGEHGVDILSLLASQHVYNIAGERRRLVLPARRADPDVGRACAGARGGCDAGAGDGVDDLLKIYVSLGALMPEAMPGAIASAAPETADRKGEARLGRTLS